MSQKLFARIVDGAVVEYPVLELHIINRAHPFDWYTPVVVLKTPEVDPIFEYTKEELTISGNFVVATPTVVQYGIDQVLNNLFYPNGRNFSMDGTDDGKVEVVFANLDPEVVNKVVNLVSKKVSEILDDFARTKNYDDVKSCATYSNSTNPTFKAEADRIIQLRDNCFANLYTYIGEVAAAVKPVPESFSEVQALLPALTWE